MDPVTMAIIIGGAQLIGGYMSNKSQEKGMKAAQAQYQQMLANLQSIGLPPDIARPLVYKELQSQGVYTPELEEALDEATTTFKTLEEDKSLRDVQIQALGKLQNVSETGLDAQDRAAMNELRRAVGTETRANTAQILQNMQSRGMGGSGAELVAQLQASQAGDEAASQAADRLGAEASRRALEAIIQGQNVAANVRTQDFNVASAKAQAEDEFARFNLQNSIARQQRNVASKNQAQLGNLSEQQRLADTNVSLYNTEQQRQREAEMQRWQARLQQMGGQNNILGGQANLAMAQAQNQGNMYSGIAQTIGGAAQGVGNYYAQQPLNQAQINYYNSLSKTPTAATPVQPVPSVYQGSTSPVITSPRVNIAPME